MAISISTSATPTLNLDYSICSFSTKLVTSTSLRFPQQIRRRAALNLRVLSPPSHHQVLHRVEATKQSFSSFDDLLANAEKPVLVDFYATWCGPCQFMGPVLDEVGAKLVDKIQVVKIDTEKYPKIANQFKIEALPTFIIFKDGKPCDRFEGALPAPKLIERIENTLKDQQ